MICPTTEGKFCPSGYFVAAPGVREPQHVGRIAIRRPGYPEGGLRLRLSSDHALISNGGSRSGLQT